MSDGERAPSVVLLNRFYWPDAAATSQMLTDLAEDLAASGWRVTVLCGRTGYALAEGRRPDVEEHRGVRIVRVWGTRLGNDSLPGRALDYLSYVAAAALALLRLPRHDVVAAMTDPPMLAMLAILGAKAKGAKSVYWLQDLYPQMAARLGTIGEGTLAYRAALGVARWMHERCDLIIAVGPRLAREAIASGARPGHTAVVHNWTDTGAVHPVAPAENDFLREQELEGRFVVLYSGNAGRAHTFGAVMEAARRLRDDPGIVFLFVGGGKAMAGLRDIVVRESLPNVRFLGYVPRERLAKSLSSASVSLVTERPEVLGLLVPSKTYAILASGRPVLYLGPDGSDVAGILREAGAGIVIAPDDADTLVREIMRLRADPESCRAMGARGREMAVSTYDRRLGTGKWANAVRSLIRGRTSCPEAPSIMVARPRFEGTLPGADHQSPVDDPAPRAQVQALDEEPTR